MSMVWHKDIPWEDKEKLLTKISEIKNGHSSFEELEASADEQGAFSTIFFVDNYVLKYTDFWEHKELEFEGASVEYEGYTLDSFEMMVQSDEEILLKVGHLDACVDLIGYTGNWVILEKIEGCTVQDIHLLENPQFRINEQQIQKLILFVQACLEQGIVPIDINAGSIFPINEDEIKIIDFNLYQTMAYIQDMGARFNPENLPYEQVAKAIVYSSSLLRK